MPKSGKKVTHRHDKGDKTQEDGIERAVGAQQRFLQDLQPDRWPLHVTEKFKGPGHGLKHHLTTKLRNHY